MAGMVNNRGFLCIFVLLSLFFLSSCRPVKQDNIYGTYIAEYNIAEERLTLNNDGTFIQKVMIKSSSEVSIATGTWTYNRETMYITFDATFMSVLDGYREFRQDYMHPRKGLVVLPLTNFIGNITMGSREGVFYKKID